MNITEKIKTLPQLPGVYRFLNKDKEIIYIGKSKNLHHRVRSYFTGQKEGKIARLVLQIEDLEFEVCDTHLEARLLECLRIKQIRPPYNSQFKRERAFIYLKIGQKPRQSALSITTDPLQGLGPFRNRQLLEAVLEDFLKLYPLTSAYLDQTPEEQSKEGEITGPSGQCDHRKPRPGEIQIAGTYSLLPRRLQDWEFRQTRECLELLFLDEGHWQPFLQGLEQAMINAADQERFQQAIFFRDFRERLKLLHRFWYEDKQLFNQLLFLRIPMEQGVKYFRIRNGCIEDQAKGTALSGAEFDRFCLNSKCRLVSAWSSFSEQARFDFLDILYSEIRTLPPEQVCFEKDL